MRQRTMYREGWNIEGNGGITKEPGGGTGGIDGGTKV